ncbi:hypothetical protein E2C01_029654 [Portunus trituberculatus]|uniref:Uncharacterized protein n=1 Tax=Portunus trituberculatus TaxID=210409 RepID=A0A5B7ES17_PORTR|nr:hypothetical protein [Portunus trituberculatus]
MDIQYRSPALRCHLTTFRGRLRSSTTTTTTTITTTNNNNDDDENYYQCVLVGYGGGGRDGGGGGFSPGQHEGRRDREDRGLYLHAWLISQRLPAYRQKEGEGEEDKEEEEEVCW